METQLDIKSDLNCKENLKIAKKLIKELGIKKNIPFKKELSYFQVPLGFKCPHTSAVSTGHRQYIELTENNRIKIWDRTCYGNIELVNIKLRILKNLTEF